MTKKTDKKYMLVLVNADVVLTYMAETWKGKFKWERGRST